jgi:hypothetical protein
MQQPIRDCWPMEDRQKGRLPLAMDRWLGLPGAMGGEIMGVSPEQLNYMKTRGRCAHCKRRASYRHWLKIVTPDGKPLPKARLSTSRDALAECPHCGARWPFYAGQAEVSPAATQEIVETEIVVDEDPQPSIPFDNRGGTAPYAVRRAFTAEWQQTCEIHREETDTARQTRGFSPDAGVTFESSAEQAVKNAYSITETKRVSRSDEVSFEVPAGVRREVRIVHRRVWQHGVLRLTRSDASIDIPFRVLTNVEIGYDFQDRS